MPKALIAAACLMTGGICAGGASAQDIYVKITDIPGTSRDNGRTDWIKVDSMSEGLTVPGGPSPGAGARTTAKPAFHDITLTKALDAASIKLKEFAATGKKITQVDIEVVQPGARPTTVYSIVLKSATITSVKTSVTAGSNPADSVALAYEEINWSFWPQQPNGAAGAEVKSGWNLTKLVKP